MGNGSLEEYYKFIKSAEDSLEKSKGVTKENVVNLEDTKLSINYDELKNGEEAISRVVTLNFDDKSKIINKKQLITAINLIVLILNKFSNNEIRTLSRAYVDSRGMDQKRKEEFDSILKNRKKNIEEFENIKNKHLRSVKEYHDSLLKEFNEKYKTIIKIYERVGDLAINNKINANKAVNIITHITSKDRKNFDDLIKISQANNKKDVENIVNSKKKSFENKHNMISTYLKMFREKLKKIYEVVQKGCENDLRLITKN
ncbi:MAG: hypothetical protein GON13_00760 [Nanoarchaeota archaeon]|nr:hypothetical protein [Nanoarchaeota archaeon]